MEVQSRTRAEWLAAQIADAIVTGELGPGLKLDEHSLAQRYNVSRTPVREALRQLDATGLIEVRPHRGAIVASMTGPQVEELFVAMGEIEATCARLCAISMTPVERRRLGAKHDEMGSLVSAGDRDGYVEANEAFHSAIYAGTHNKVVADIAAGLRRRLGPHRRAQFRAAGRLERSHAEHGVVTRAIESGDAAAAHAAMLHHVSLVEEAFDRLVVARWEP